MKSPNPWSGRPLWNRSWKSCLAVGKRWRRFSPAVPCRAPGKRSNRWSTYFQDTTLADANETHDWRIFADFAQILIATARPLYARDPLGVELNNSLYALDSTTIDLCLSLFPWA